MKQTIEELTGLKVLDHSEAPLPKREDVPVRQLSMPDGKFFWKDFFIKRNKKQWILLMKFLKMRKI